MRKIKILNGIFEDFKSFTHLVQFYVLIYFIRKEDGSIKEVEKLIVMGNEWML